MNNTIFNSYLTGEERAEAIEESRYDLIFSRADMLFEMVELRLAQNIKEAEFKVFSENGTYDDYQYYIEEAEAEAAQKKQSILGTIWNTIKKLIKTIGEKLASIKVDAGDENTEVEIEEDAITDNNAIAGALTTLKNASTAVNGNGADPIAKANSILKISGIIGGITIGAGAAAGVAAKMVKKKKGELMGLKKTAEAALSDANNVATAADSLADSLDTVAGGTEAAAGKNKVSEGMKKVANAARELGSNIYNKIIKPIAEIVKKLARAIGTKAKAAANKVFGKWHIANDEEKNKPEAKEVVADDIADDKFDKSKQIKLSDISNKVPNVKVGDYVIKEMGSKPEDTKAEGNDANGEQPANNSGEQKAADGNQGDENSEPREIVTFGKLTRVSNNWKSTKEQPVYVLTDGSDKDDPKADGKKGALGLNHKDVKQAAEKDPENFGKGKLVIYNNKSTNESSDDVIYDDDVNPFVEDVDTSYDKYDLELSEIADMFRSL